MTVAKETKVQRVERLKKEKNAWEHLDEIRQFAKTGRDSVPPEWASTYFRTWGVYTQGDGVGVIGGANGEGKSTAYFMVRIRIPNGVLTSGQTRLIAAISEEYGRGYADITVRQNIQLHWIAIESLPDLLERLWAAGLTTTGACGDTVRTVTGCPVAGLDAREIIDASSLAVAVDRELGGNPAFYNLPRKFKISVTGCRDWCSYPEINDIGFTATTRIRAGKPEIGFSLRVGGGLSKEPHIAVRLNAFVKWDQVVPVARGIAEVFRDSDSLRQSRDKARMKYLFLKQGWTADTFLTALQSRLSFTLDPAEPEELPDDIHRDHTGIHAQKQTGLSFVGASVLRGRISPSQLRTVADLCDRFAKGRVRLTIMQNILIADVASDHAETVAAELVTAGLHVRPSVFARGTIACTGSEFCKLALTETKGFARWLSETLDERLPGFQEQIKLHITGCPNSCGQHWIADIGIEGKKIKTDGEMVDAYYFCVGGSVGHFASIARPVGFRCVAGEVPDAIVRALGGFQKNRNSGESLREFFARHNNDEIRALLAGNAVQAAARDIPEGRVPHGVE
ncbi:MAG TPA: hypothetical protein VFF42_01635 [Candidatus Eremiobacteraceae bacterium]|nr:hypothetical protein [Candidatus Eremiobacteraceae bacterium]